LLPEAADLAGAAVGIIRPKDRLLLGSRVRPGDVLLIALSTGIHANGLTLARRAAARLPLGYATPLPTDPGRTFGEALLDPAPLYSRLVQALLDAGIELHYAVHVTGHGWRKLMRAPQPLTYRVQVLPPVPPVLRALQAWAGMSAAEAYSTLNMGAGMVFYVAPGDAGRAIAAARAGAGAELLEAGVVEPGPRRVVLEPLGVLYEAESLQIR